MSFGEEPAGERLLRAARAGDPDALGPLLDRYRGYLTLLARVQIGRQLQGKVDPADLVQETFLDAHRNFAGFRGDSEPTFAAWLRGILAGHLAHLLRRYFDTRSRDVHLEEALVREMESSSSLLDRGLTAADSSPSDRVSRREQALLLADALEQLPADYREVIVLRQIEELPFAEVARRMGRSKDSVQKLWVRGLDRLRLVLAGPLSGGPP
jgi:RNA polymerase sigma-70 factor (ECF subfamily)